MAAQGECASDASFMRTALERARAAAAAGEVPVGAVLVQAERIIAAGHNVPISSHDPTAHAEIEVLRAGGRALGSYRLTDTTLYVTLEPCVMCSGALVHARVERVVFAADDPKTGAAGSVFDTLVSPLHNHCITVDRGLRAVESAEMLRTFFRSRR
jgi:tRNA(adenine34) deaminase